MSVTMNLNFDTIWDDNLLYSHEKRKYEISYKTEYYAVPGTSLNLNNVVVNTTLPFTLTEGFFLAGGACLSMLNKERFPVKDFDIFFSRDLCQSEPDYDKLLKQQIGEIVKTMPYAGIVQTEGLVTILSEPKVQIITNKSLTMADVVSAFDLAASQICYANETLFYTKAFAFTILTGMQPITPARRSRTYGIRIAKYFNDKKFGIIVPVVIPPGKRITFKDNSLHIWQYPKHTTIHGAIANIKCDTTSGHYEYDISYMCKLMSMGKQQKKIKYPIKFYLTIDDMTLPYDSMAAIMSLSKVESYDFSKSLKKAELMKCIGEYSELSEKVNIPFNVFIYMKYLKTVIEDGLSSDVQWWRPADSSATYFGKYAVTMEEWIDGLDKQIKKITIK